MALADETSVEQLLQRVTPRGRWQLLVFAQSFIPLCLFCTLSYQQSYLLAGPMRHRCVEPFQSNYSVVGTSMCVSESGQDCEKFEYESDYFENTIIAEWNLVCWRSALVPVYKSMVVVGSTCGAIVWALLGDRFGRRPLLRALGPAWLGSALLLALAPNFTVAMVARFLHGFVSTGYWEASFVLNMELSEPKRRNLIGILMNTQWMLSGIVAGVAGYFVRNWRYLHLYTIAAGVVGIPLSLLLPESPRWLITHERYDDALKIFKKAAQIDGNKASDNLPTIETLQGVHDAHVKTETTADNVPTVQRDGIMAAMFRSAELRRRTYMLIFQWIVVILVFYGVLFYATGDIGGGSPYWTIVLQGFFRLLASYPLILALDRFGKKPVLMATLGLTALMLALFAALPTAEPEWALVAMLLQVGAIVFDDCAVNALYTFTSELYPTVLRQTGLAVCSMSSRVGAFAAPFASDILGDLWRSLPAIVFASICAIGAVALVLLPEMNMRRLPDTVHDTELQRSEELALEERAPQEGSNATQPP